MHSCVIPALTEVINTFTNLLKAHVVLWENIVCKKKEWLWYVGVPKHIEHHFRKWEIHIVPFVWKDNDTNTDYLNINADDITLYIWKLLWENVGKIFFLTWSGWIQDINGKNISFITKSNIERILKWEHKKIHIYGWMYKKVQTIQDIVNNGISALVLTHLKSFKDEIEKVSWCWTYIVDEQSIKVEESIDYSFFQELYQTQKRKWNWKKRNKDEIDEVYNNHKIISINGIPLGWVSVKPSIINHVAEEWNGIWKILFEKIINQYRPLFAYSRQEKFFEKMWFFQVPRIVSNTWAELYKRV